MQLYKADLHVHTQLSPCGDLSMSPDNIIRAAKEKNIDILAITDHNSTKQAGLLVELGKENGIYVLPGCEVNTKEEVHVVTFFETIEIAKQFQEYIDEKMPYVLNKIDLFGHQVVVDRDECIIEEEDRALFVGLNASIYDIEQFVHKLNGLFIPSHIERKAYGLLSQLGFVPEDLNYDALEVSYRMNTECFVAKYPEISKDTIIKSSDAHLPDQLGRAFSYLTMDNLSFDELKMAIRREAGRGVELSS